MTLEQIKDIIVLIANDNSKPFSFVLEDFEDALHLSQLKYFKQKIGLPEEYQPGMPVPRQSFEITERITEDLRPFKVLKGWNINNPVAIDSNGLITYPDDYYYITSLTYYINTVNPSKTYERKIERLSDLEYEDVVTSVLKEPDAMFPVCNLQATHIRCYPLKSVSANMAYLRFPKRPVYGLTSEQEYIEYDNTQSTNLEWNDLAIIDIITIFLSELGIITKNQTVLEYAEKVKQKGI